MHPTLTALNACTSINRLKSTLHNICTEFGVVTRLDVLPANQGRKQQALCFLRMACPEQEARLTKSLGIGRFAGDLVLVVDMPDSQFGDFADSEHPASVAPALH